MAFYNALGGPAATNEDVVGLLRHCKILNCVNLCVLQYLRTQRNRHENAAPVWREFYEIHYLLFLDVFLPIQSIPCRKLPYEFNWISNSCKKKKLYRKLTLPLCSWQKLNISNRILHGPKNFPLRERYVCDELNNVSLIKSLISFQDTGCKQLIENN